MKALWRHRRQAFLVVALTMGGTVAYYTYTTYLTKYLSNSAGLPKETATLVSFCTLFAGFFPTGIRALGVALPYDLSDALFGGTAEYVALWFKNGGRSRATTGTGRGAPPSRPSSTWR